MNGITDLLIVTVGAMFGLVLALLFVLLVAYGTIWSMLKIFDIFENKIKVLFEESENKEKPKGEEKKQKYDSDPDWYVLNQNDSVNSFIDEYNKENDTPVSFSQGCLKYGNYDTCEKFDNKYLECRLCLQECIHRSNFPKY